MKSRKPLITISISTLFIALATTGLSVAWFTSIASTRRTDNPIGGIVQDTYYESGTGDAEDDPLTPEIEGPYVITRPRHLYNLAWLQDLGSYNKHDGSDDDHQFYFKLGDNIDMSSFGAIPPIGTEQNPFVGNFDGQGFVISGVTISNDFEEYNSHPSVISGWNGEVEGTQPIEKPHILGLFGVVGDYSNTANKPTSYSSAVNEFKNTGITGATIKTVLNDSLMGIAAGYVRDDNTTDSYDILSNIVVDNSTISLPETGQTESYGNDVNGVALNKISEFSLVGYTNKKAHVVNASKSLYGVNIDNNYTFNATEAGNANGWGGSVDMKSVLERLITIKNSGTKAAFPFKTTYSHHEVTGETDENSTNTTRTGNSNYNSYPSTLINNNDEIGHFLFLHRNDAYDPYYAMFGGGHLQVDQYYKGYEHTGRYITDGTNYLCLNGNALTNGTNPDTATLWNFESYSTGVYYITTQYNGTKYYLNYNNGALNTRTSTGTSRRWQYDDSGTYRDIKYNGDTNYHLTYSNGWILENYSTDAYYLIHDGNGHYMGAVSSYVPTSVTEANAMRFGYTSTGNTRGYYNLTNSVYLGWRRSSDPLYMRSEYYTSATYRLYPSTSSTTIVANGYGTGYLRTSTKNANTPDNNNYYVRWNDNAWTATTTVAQATQVTVEYVEPPAYAAKLLKTENLSTPRKGPDEYLSSSDTTYKMNYESDDVTYFPLSTINNTNDFRPDKSNTGYIVSGTTIDNSATNIESKNSIIRFSNLFGLEDWTFGNTKYPKSLSDDFNLSTGEFSNIYTIVKSNNRYVRSGNIANDYTNYPKLKNAKETLGNVMKTENNPDKKAYGVHFMDAAISMNALTTADYIKVNGQEYTDYELPVNSIDFHLKEFGYINFMAGTYYRNDSSDRNNSFFALYQIERLDESPKEINRILEIKNVYQHSSKNKTYSYVYELSDGNSTFYTKPYVITSSEGDREWLYDSQTSWSRNQYVDSLPNNYTQVFDVGVIKKNDIDGTYSTNDFDYHPFYFEIPMNDGEFCLGSVAGATGAYLMYLDIAANAAKTNRTIAYEKFTITQNTYVLPAGVALQALPNPQNIPHGQNERTPVIDISAVIDVTNSVCVEIKESAQGNPVNGDYKMDRTDNTVAITRDNTTLAPPVYAAEIITLTGEGNLTIVPFESESHNIQRMQYYDYLINTNTLCVTTITDYYTTNGSFENRVIEQNRYSGNAVTANPTGSLLYDPTGITGTVKDDSADIKIYNTNSGISYLISEFIDPDGVKIDADRLPTTKVLEFRLTQDGSSYTDATTLVLTLDTLASQTETYYKYLNYTIVLTPDSGSITVKIISYSGSFTISTYNDFTKETTDGSVTTVITINGTTVTGANQTIPEP